MDYFYLSDPKSSNGAGAQGMSTKELQRWFREMGKSDKGKRPALVQIYERVSSQEEVPECPFLIP